MEKLEQKLNEVIEILGFMRHHMATSDDVEELRTDIGTQFDTVCNGVNTLSAQLREIDNRLDGVNRHLNMIPERIATIEQHLGIDKTIAA